MKWARFNQNIVLPRHKVWINLCVVRSFFIRSFYFEYCCCKIRSNLRTDPSIPGWYIYMHIFLNRKSLEIPWNHHFYLFFKTNDNAHHIICKCYAVRLNYVERPVRFGSVRSVGRSVDQFCLYVGGVRDAFSINMLNITIVNYQL